MGVREEVRKDLRERIDKQKDDGQPQPPAIKRPYPELIDVFNSMNENLIAINDKLGRLTPTGLGYHHVVTIPSATSTTDLRGLEPPEDNYPKREQIHLRLKRNADITVIAEGPGNIFIIMTSNGLQWTVDEIKIAPNGVVRLIDVYDMVLRTDVDNTTYRAIEYPYRPHEIVVTKAVVGRAQRNWADLYSTLDLTPPDPIAANSVRDVEDFYTVPAGYNLNLLGGFVSCRAPGWQLLKLVVTNEFVEPREREPAGLVGEFWYYKLGHLFLGSMSSTIISAGNTLSYEIYNYDYVERHFTVSLTGMLDKIW